MASDSARYLSGGISLEAPVMPASHLHPSLRFGAKSNQYLDGQIYELCLHEKDDLVMDITYTMQRNRLPCAEKVKISGLVIKCRLLS